MPYADKTSEKAVAYRETTARRKRESRIAEVLTIATAGPAPKQKLVRICISMLSRHFFRRKKVDADRTSAYRKSKPGYALAAMRQFKYGLSTEDILNLNSAQRGLCACCGEPLPKSFHIDHNHKTGAVRGLLCSGCNLGLGQFKDSPERCEKAATYLRRTS